MADTPKVKIGIDIAGLQQSINGLNQLAQQPGKIGEAAEKAIKPIQKLLVAAEKGSSITSAEIQAMLNDINNSQSKLSRTINEETNAFKQEAAAYTEAKNKAKELNDQLSELEKQKRKLAKPTNVKTMSDWVSDPRASKARLKADMTGKSQAYKDFYRNADASKISSYAKMNADNYEDQATKDQIQAAQDLQKVWKEYRDANIAAAEAQKNIDKQIAQVNSSLKEQQAAVQKSKEALSGMQATFAPDGSPQMSQGLKEANASYTDLNNKILETETTLKTFAEQGETTGQALFTLGNKTKVAQTNFQKFTSHLVQASFVMRAFKKLINEAINTVKSMDESITNMAVVTGRSREELQGMTSDFAKMAHNTSSTITEMANLTTEFLRQGRAMKDAQELAEETAKAAKIAGISTSDSITYMTAAINGFNLTASDASHVSDVFAKLAASSATTYEDLAVSLSKVSAQANQAGMSIEYTTALLAKGIETTQEAPESIGTALKTIIARFRELDDYGSTLEDGVSVNAVEDALKAVGVEARDASGQFRNLEDVLNELGPKWDDLNAMQKQAVAQAAAGTRQQSRFLAIMQDWDRTLELVNSAQSAAGASAAQYEEYAKGLTASLTNLQSSWQYLVTSLTNSDWIVNIVNELNDIVNGFATWADSWGDFFPIVITGVVAFIGYKKVLEKMQEAEDRQLEEASYRIQHNLDDEAKGAKAKLEANIEYNNSQIEGIKEVRKKQLEANIAALQGQKQQLEQANLFHRMKMANMRAEMLYNQHMANNDTSYTWEQAQKDAEQDVAGLQNSSAYTQAVEKIDNQIAEEQNKLNDVANYTNTEIEKLQNQNKEYEKLLSKANTYGSGAAGIISNLGASFTRLFGNFKQMATSTSVMTNVGKKTISLQESTAFNNWRSENNLSGTSTQDAWSQWQNLDKENRSSLIENASVSTGATVKNTVTNALGSAVNTFGPMLAAFVVKAAISGITELINYSETQLSEIAEKTADSYSKATKNTGIATLRSEYEKLNKTVNRTADEEERMREIEEELSDEYDIDVKTGDAEENIRAMNAAIGVNKAEIAENTEEAMVDAFEAAAIEGQEVFENTKFTATIEAEFDTMNNADTSTVLGQRQSEIYKNIAKNVDYEKMAKSVYKSSAGEQVVGGVVSGLAAAGVAGGIIIALAMNGLANAWNPVGWASAVVAAVGATALAVTAAIKLISGEAAKEQAELVTNTLIKTAEEVNTFSAEMATTLEGTLSDQFAIYAANVDKYSAYTKNAINETYSGFAMLSRIGFSTASGTALLDSLQNKHYNEEGDIELDISDDAMTNIINQASKMGDEAGTAFLKQWDALTTAGLESSDMYAILAATLKGQSSSDIQTMMASMGYSSSTINSVSNSIGAFDVGSLIKEYQEEAVASAKESYKTAETMYQLAYKDFDAYTKQYADDYKQYKNLGYSQKEIIEALSESAENAKESFDTAGEAADDLSEAMLDLISAYGDLSSLNDAITSMSTSSKNLREFAEKVKDGSVEASDWLTAQGKFTEVLLSDSWADASDETRAAMIEASDSYFAIADKMQKTYDAFLNRVDAENDLSVANVWETRKEYENKIAEYTEELANYSAGSSQYEATKNLIDYYTEKVNDDSYWQDQIDAIEENTKETKELVELAKNTLSYLTATSASEAAASARKTLASASSDKGYLSGYAGLVSYYDYEANLSAANIDKYFESAAKTAAESEYSIDISSWRGMMDEILNGDASSYIEWLKTASDQEKEYFNTLWEDYSVDYQTWQDYLDNKTDAEQDLLDAQVELEEDAIDTYKSLLEDQYNETKESLDKRKELYQEYFDEINKDEDDETYANKRSKLLNAISALSSSTDATSLSKLKEYQSELEELEEEQLDSEREARQDATLDALDTEESQLEEIYNNAIANNAAIWQSFQELGIDAIEALYKEVAGYDKMSDNEKEQWKAKWAIKKANLSQSIPANANGGLVDYTGLAWVDGNKSTPEAFLSADQTALIGNLAASLGTISSSPYMSTDNSSTIQNLNINVSGVTGDANNIANTVYQAFAREMNVRGINTNRKK